MEVHENDNPTAEGKYQKFERCLGRFVKKLAVWLLIWLPILFIQFALLHALHYYRYPKITLRSLLFLCLTLLPTVCILITRKRKLTKVVKSIIGKLCALFLPVSFICSFLIFGYSETTDIQYYRELDASCPANLFSIYQDLFPTYSHYFVVQQMPNGDWEDVYLDARYYYRFMRYNQAFDIYAEWPLEQEQFNSEITRVTEFFEAEAAENSYYQYLTIQKGSYSCLIYYRGEAPFEKENGQYAYYIFAYNTQNNKVGYIACDSYGDGDNQPYYLQLDWQ